MDDLLVLLLFTALVMLLVALSKRRRTLTRMKTSTSVLERAKPSGLFALAIVAGLAGVALVVEKLGPSLPSSSSASQATSPVAGSPPPSALDTTHLRPRLAPSMPAPAGTATNAEADSPPGVLVSASTSSRLYESNEGAADEYYEGRSLKISGTVQSTDKDVFSNAIVGLHAGDRFTSVHASLDDAHQGMAASLKTGQKITLTCESGAVIVGSLILRKCAPAA